ncbi:hypothetical protein LEA_15530, partial [human gut metagenome]
MEYGPVEPIDVTLPGRGLFISNEGNFTYGNASLSYYDITHSALVTNEDGSNDIFYSANGIPLGDVAQSAIVRGNTVYVIINNSGVIFAIDRRTAKITGTIRGLTSPRYMHFLSDTKAYVTDLYARAITIVNPESCQITGRIDVNNGYGRQHPTEQMVQYKKLRLYELLVIRQQDPGDRLRYGQRRGFDRGRHPAHIAGDRQVR